MKFNRIFIFLILILVLGFALRFYGIDFDVTCCQHPDERAIVMSALPLTFPTSIPQFLSPESPLNPHFFAYGNLPLYLLKWAATAASSFNPIFLEYSYINYVGRFISIIADLVTIFAIFKIGEKLFSKKVGLFSAFIYSVSVLPIQYSHFFTSDILLTMFITLTLWRSIKFYNKPNLKNALLLGICAGLSLATKISSIPIIISILFAVSIDFIFVFLKHPHKTKHWLPHVPPFLVKLIADGLLIFMAALATFFIAQPYALIDWPTFLKHNLEQSQMTHNAYIFPYTLQYVGKIPYFYELKNVFLWGLGPIISFFVFVGIVKTLQNFSHHGKAQKAEQIILLSFLLIYFLVVGRFAVGFMRYLLPIYPIAAILAGVSLHFLFERVNKFGNDYVKTAIKTFTIVLLLIWPLSFVSIYSNTNTRLAATEWINNNLPEESTFTHETWDDTIPMINVKNYSIVDLPMYDQPDNRAKWEMLNSKIKNADYIVIASNRLSTPIRYLSDCSKYKVCFPIASKFYKDLFAENGYKRVAEFTSYPTIPILNIPIDDQGADESFTVYDHPKIMIFKSE